MSVGSFSSPISPLQGGLTRKPFYWYSAMLLLLVLQLISGSQLAFSLLVFGFCLLTYITVVVCGGVFTLSGFCIFYLACQHVLVSQLAKIYYWQPADSYLNYPVETIAVYDLGMFGLFLGCLLAKRLGNIRQKPIFGLVTEPQRLMWLSYVTTVLAVSQIIFLSTQGSDQTTGTLNVGGVKGLLSTLGFLSPLSIASGTAYIILSSNGKRSIGITNGLAILVPCISGLLFSNREAMVVCIVIYYLTCFAFKFKFRVAHLAIFLLGAYMINFILFPYALYARKYNRSAFLNTNVQRSIEILEDVVANPNKYQELQTHHQSLTHMRHLYYSAAHAVPNATLDRFSLLASADGIVEGTLINGTIGMETITPGFEMAIPRLFAPEKNAIFRNTLAHRTKGLVGDKDYTTGITIGFIPDSFSSYSWIGAVIIPCLLSFCLFGAYRLMFVNSLWNNVYAISLIFYLAWPFSEGGIGSVITLILQGSIVTLCMFFILGLLTDSLTGIVYRLRKAHIQERMRPQVNITRRSSQTNTPKT